MVKKHSNIFFLIIISLLLVSCNSMSFKQNKDPIEITLWHYYNSKQKAIIDSGVKEFNKTKGLELGILVEAISKGSLENLENNLFAAADRAIGAEKMPDLFISHPDMGYKLFQGGYVADYRKYIDDKEMENYISIVSVEDLDKKPLDVFPIFIGTEVLILNKEAWNEFSNATGANIEDLYTWEGITKLSETYYDWTNKSTRNPNDGKAFFGIDAMSNFILTSHKQLGLDLYTVEDNNIVLNIDRDIMKKIWDNFYVPYINGYFTTVGKSRSDDFKTNDIILGLIQTLDASLTLSSSDYYNPYEIGVEILPYPVYEGGIKYAPEQGVGALITKGEPEYEEASMEFLKWFTEPERNLEYSLEAGYLPVRTDLELDDIMEYIDEIKEEDEFMAEIAIANIETKKNYEMYRNYSFGSSLDIRLYLEYDLKEKAIEDRTLIEKLIELDTSKEEAVKLFDNDENFERWLISFEKDLLHFIK